MNQIYVDQAEALGIDLESDLDSIVEDSPKKSKVSKFKKKKELLENA